MLCRVVEDLTSEIGCFLTRESALYGHEASIALNVTQRITPMSSHNDYASRKLKKVLMASSPASHNFISHTTSTLSSGTKDPGLRTPQHDLDFCLPRRLQALVDHRDKGSTTLPAEASNVPEGVPIRRDHSLTTCTPLALITPLPNHSPTTPKRSLSVPFKSCVNNS